MKIIKAEGSGFVKGEKEKSRDEFEAAIRRYARKRIDTNWAKEKKRRGRMRSEGDGCGNDSRRDGDGDDDDTDTGIRSRCSR